MIALRHCLPSTSCAAHSFHESVSVTHPRTKPTRGDTLSGAVKYRNRHCGLRRTSAAGAASPFLPHAAACLLVAWSGPLFDDALLPGGVGGAGPLPLRWQAGTPDLMARSVLKCVNNPGGAQAWELACPGAYESQIYADNATLNLCPQVAELPGPLLFVCADPKLEGAWSPARVNAAIASTHPHDYVAIPGSGHMLQLEFPERCHELVQDFFDKHA